MKVFGRTRRLIFAMAPVAAAVVMLFALPAPARAACAAPVEGYDPFKASDVVVDGVLLSGPSFGGALLSPARFHVVRYLKGRGPRVVWIGTPLRQVKPGDLDVAFETEPEDGSSPRAGEIYRVFARTAGRRKRAQLEYLGGGCDDHRLSGTRGVLRPVGRGLMRRFGRSSWRARLFRDRGALRCLRFGRTPERYDANGECGYLRRRRSTLVGLGARQGTTAIAVAAKRLTGLTVVRVADGARFDAAARGALALAVLPGILERKEVLISARYRDGSTRTFGGPARRASVADPLGGRPWVADYERAHPSTARRRVCVIVDKPFPRTSYLDQVDTPSGACGNTTATPFFYAIRRERRFEAGRQIATHTAVFGAISQAVLDVTVTGPYGSRRPAISRRGRSFIALFAGDVPDTQLGLRFVLRDGRTLAFSGRSDLNLAAAAR